MKTNKRILSVLMCIAMILSMFSSFAYAAGSGEVDTQATDETPVLSTTAPSNLGAQPTVDDIPAPVIDENVIVVDATATADATYTLVWDGVTYSELTFTFGENLFNTIAAADANTTAGDTVLVFSQTKTHTITVEGVSKDVKNTNFTKGANYYTPAWNIMPFITNGNADGTGWTINPEFVEKAVFFRYADIATTVLSGETLNLYGWGTNYFINFQGRTSMDLSLGLYNFLASQESVAIIYNKTADTNIPAWTAGTSLTLKNLAFCKGTSGIFSTNAHLAQTTVFDGIYFGGTSSWDVADGKTWWQNTTDRFGTPSKASFTMKNCNFQPGKFPGGLRFSLVDGNGVSNGNTTTVTFENNVFSDSMIGYNDTSNSTYSGFLPFRNQFNGIDVFTFKNNIVIDSDGADVPFVANRYMNRCKAIITDNKIVGYDVNLGTDPASSTILNSSTYPTAAGSTIDNNFVDSNGDGIGESYYMAGTTNKYMAKDYYLDANMSLLASELIGNVSVENGYVYQDKLTAKIYLPTGATLANIALADGVSVAVKDANGAAVDPTTAGAGTYTATVTRTVSDAQFTVDYSFVVEQLTAPLFSIAYDDPADLIDASKAILITNAFESTAEGLVVKTTWADTTEYSFVKGVNLFDTIEDASAYTLANNILDAHYLVLDINGSKGASAPSQSFTMPGKYFTRNYNKNPYTKSDKALDPYGLEWKSNINTEAADSFVIDNGISIKYLNLSKMAKAGDVEFYGFRITYTIEMNTSSAGNRLADSDMNVKFVNSYADTQDSSYSLVFTDNILNSAEKAEQYNDTLTFENFYFDPQTTAGLFKGDCFIQRNIIIDGMFMDEGGATLAAAYLHTYTTDHSFTIKNSNFRNVVMPLYMRGDYGQSTDSRLNRSLEYTNNIFYNASFASTSALFYLYIGYFNKLDFTGNTVYAAQDNTEFKASWITNNGDRHPDITVTIKDNVLNGFGNSFNIGRWINSSASEVGNNWVSPTRETDTKLTGVTFTMTNNSSQGTGGYEYSTDYYIDSGKKMLASEFMKKFDFVMADGGAYKNGTTLDLYVSTGKSAADLSLRDANATIVGWKGADGTAVDAATITNAADGTAYTLTAGYPIDGHVYTVDFTVNVHANVVTGYAASTYADRVPTHPSEKTELVDIPHFPSGFEDETGLINPNNAAFIDADTGYGSTKYTIATGDYKVITWNGKQYLTVMNTTLFQAPENAYTALKDKGVDMPEYLIAGAEWGVQQGGYYSGTESNYTIRRPGKYFMPSYANKPYIKGDGKGNGWVSNIGTGEGQFNPDNAIKTGYIHIDDTSIAGDYELYGYTVASTIKDARTTNANEIHLTFYNSYFEGTGAVYDSIYKYDKTSVLSNGANHDSVTFKDTYFVVSGGRSFLRSPASAELIFDGVFADFTGQTYSGTRYFNQVNNNYKFEIRNSFFTGNMTDKTYIEGYNGAAYATNVTTGNKQFILENNIFKNYSFYGDTTFLTMKHQYFTEITIRNNYIDNSGKSMVLFSASNLDSNAGVDETCKYTIEENTLIGFSGNLSTVSTIGRSLTEGSVIAKNYTSTDAALEGVQLMNDTLTGDYYLDPARELLASQYVLTSWTADGAYIDIDRENNAISYKATKDAVFTDENLVLGSDKIVAKFYKDAELTEEITDITAHVDDAYLVLYFENSEGFVIDRTVFAVDFEFISDKYFKDVYVVPETDDIKTTIDKEKAIIVDYASKDVADGHIFTTTWKGVEYDFIKGVNAFATFAELNAYLDTANIEYPHVLMKTVSDGTYAGTEEGKQDYSDIEPYGEKSIRLMIIKHHGAYYTENYNIKPYTVTDGVWAKNPEFVPANGIVARWLKNEPKLGNGNIELYGFSVISAFQIFSESGEGRTDEIPNLYVENGYTIGDNASIDPSAAPVHGHNDYTWKKNNVAAGEIYLKNVYTDPSITTNALLYAGSLPSKVTYDGVFIDGGNHTYTQENDMNIYIEAFELNIINCYIKDSKSNIVIRDRADANAEKEFKINIQNTVFDNATLGGEAVVAFNDGVTAFTFENNTVKNAQNVDLIKYADTDTHNETLDLTIRNNVLAGVNGAINAGDSVNIVDISGNNFAGAWNAEGTEVGDQITVAGTDYANRDYWLVYDGENFSKISNVVYDMTLNFAGAEYTSFDDVVIDDAFIEDGFINLKDMLEGEQYNTVAVYAASDIDKVAPYDIEKVPVSTSIALVIECTSHDKTAASVDWNITINVKPLDVSINNEKAPGQAVGTRYRLSWRAIVNGGIDAEFIPDGQYTEHRVGAIYALNGTDAQAADAKRVLEAFVAELNAGTKAKSELDAYLNSATYTESVVTYALEENRAKWDSETASYRYYFNVVTAQNKTRDVMMYAIYYNVESAQYEIIYSDFVRQTAPTIAAE